MSLYRRIEYKAAFKPMKATDRVNDDFIKKVTNKDNGDTMMGHGIAGHTRSYIPRWIIISLIERANIFLKCENLELVPLGWTIYQL